MNLAIDLPEDLAVELQARWGDLPGRARQAVVIEAYRSGALSQAQAQELLGVASRWEMDQLLKEHGVYLDYTEADLRRDLEVSQKAARQ
jgi:predicted HTH domain antitoxin